MDSYFAGNFVVGSVCGQKNNNYMSNCYYLAGTSRNAFGTGSGANCESKTKLLFQNGDVAFLLQGGSRQNATQIWGQTLGKNASPVLKWQTDSEQVYYAKPNSPCKGGFSNTPDGTWNHQYDANGYCIYCGAPHIAYTVTIPATLDGTTHVTAPYTIQKIRYCVKKGDPVLTAENGDTPDIPLTFVKPDAAPYAGRYTGTVTFEVSVGPQTTP